jgi:hypothetical protein
MPATFWITWRYSSLSLGDLMPQSDSSLDEEGVSVAMRGTWGLVVDVVVISVAMGAGAFVGAGSRTTMMRSGPAHAAAMAPMPAHELTRRKRFMRRQTFLECGEEHKESAPWA